MKAHHSGKGSIRGLMLNLMVDHSLLFHPAQLARINNKLPAYTVGSLTEKVKVGGLLSTFEKIIMSDAPLERFKKFAKTLENDVVSCIHQKAHN